MNLKFLTTLFKKQSPSFLGNDFVFFESSKHQLSMLGMSYSDLISETEQRLSIQIPETKLTAFKVMAEPQWLMTTSTANAEGKALLHRAACAVEVSCFAAAPTLEKTVLHFILSFAFTDIGQKTANHKFWIDVGGSLAEFGKDGLLMVRMLELALKPSQNI